MARHKQAGRRWHETRTRFKARCQASRTLCHHCGQAIDYTAPSAAPNSFEADHRYPVSTHPHLMYDESLLLPSHSSCNRARGNKPLEQGQWVQPDW